MFRFFKKRKKEIVSTPTKEELFVKDFLDELSYTRSKFPNNDAMYIALGEEVGELAKATLDETPTRVREEAIQVAVMAARVYLDGDASVIARRERNGLEPLGVYR